MLVSHNLVRAGFLEKKCTMSIVRYSGCEPEFRNGALTVLGASITLNSLHTAIETHRETHG